MGIYLRTRRIHITESAQSNLFQDIEIAPRSSKKATGRSVEARRPMEQFINPFAVPIGTTRICGS